MTRGRYGIWKCRVDRVRAFLQSEFYDDPRILGDVARDKLTQRRVLKELLQHVDACPVGDGTKYHKHVEDLLVSCLGAAVDPTCVKSEFAAEGGRGDSEIALRLENLARYPLWDVWADQYAIKSIVLEVKNRKGTSTVQDVFQILGYLTVSGRGRFGILVARRGFTSDAMVLLTSIARANRYLILAFDHSDLYRFARASVQGSTPTMVFLRRKETDLVQGRL